MKLLAREVLLAAEVAILRAELRAECCDSADLTVVPRLIIHNSMRD